MIRLGRRWLPIFLIIAFCTLIYLPGSPAIMPVPARDGGVFWYVAQQMLEGRAPYVDVWDHKPLAAYMIPLLGLLFSGGWYWGPWLMALVSLSVAAGMGYWLLRHQFGSTIALVGTILWVVGLTYFYERDPFFTEMSALPFQIAAYLAGMQILRTPSAKSAPWLWLGLGFCSAYTLLLKPPLATTPIIVVLVVLFSMRKISPRQWLVWVGMFLIGGLVPSGLVWGYLTMHGAISAGIDQVLVYNQAYSHVTWAERWAMLTSFVWQHEINAVGIAAGCVAMVALVRGRVSAAPLRTLLIIALLDWPITLMVGLLPARGYHHYFTGMLWPATVLLCWLGYVLINQTRLNSRLVTLSVGLMTGIMFISSLSVWYLYLSYRSTLNTASAAAVEYITTSIPADQQVLLWGAETSIYVATGRQAPTRIPYLYPLFTPGYPSDRVFSQFQQDLTHRPAYIIDTAATNPMVPPLDPALRQQWLVYGWSDGVDPAFLAFCDNLMTDYTPVTTLDGQWVVYRLQTLRP
ncbi:hypothetical protein OSCT_0871 [Oscillochloris trichoides DG-6]|uniref:Glycosyltransferase RgtA/B/C/D-like domain-containing protein n=1 Tax=Oscillochloris trichoides DG-6 TaxID=765420 RepID=E1IC20_9CHLR|nr:hypothetical protein [Oscillochloris trichoides]EFO81282.1 hypothetical protein OSCT_0871 [Oscillochloris trichoides DG-6]